MTNSQLRVWQLCPLPQCKQWHWSRDPSEWVSIRWHSLLTTPRTITNDVHHKRAICILPVHFWVLYKIFSLEFAMYTVEEGAGWSWTFSASLAIRSHGSSRFCWTQTAILSSHKTCMLCTTYLMSSCTTYQILDLIILCYSLIAYIIWLGLLFMMLWTCNIWELRIFFFATSSLLTLNMLNLATLKLPISKLMW